MKQNTDKFDILYQEILSLNKDKKEISISLPTPCFLEIGLLVYHKALLMQSSGMSSDKVSILYSMSETILNKLCNNNQILIDKLIAEFNLMIINSLEGKKKQ